jgi:hypothetical protein
VKLCQLNMAVGGIRLNKGEIRVIIYGDRMG